MSKKRRKDPKLKALQRRNAVHPHPHGVTDEAFTGSDFFDARDIVQVKYEMLRRARVDGHPVVHAASAFALSRPSFYEARDAFERDGIAGLLPKKRGPHGAHKLTTPVVNFLVDALETDPSLRATELVNLLKARFDLLVHPRSIERALGPRGKEQGATARGVPGRRSRSPKG